MSFLSAIPQELLAAASQLEGIGASLSAQNAAAAIPTSTIAPAAADQVSLLQAGIFGAYGTLYQQIAAEAELIQQQFLQTLNLSSGTYTATEAANAADAANPATTFLENLAVFLGPSTNGSPLSLSGITGTFINYEAGNWASAMSCLVGLGGGGLVPDDWWAGGALGAAADAADIGGMGAAATMGSTSGVGAAMGEATLVGAMSTPPSWAAAATPVSATGVTALAGTPISAAGPAGAGGIVPGMPGMLGGRNNGGFGAPRYGIKPIIMKKLGLVAV